MAIEIPVHWGADDWPPFAHFEEIGCLIPVREPSDRLRGFFGEFEAQYAAGGFWMSIWPPFLTGRLARWAAVERRLERVLKRGGVWFATLEEIAAHFRTEHDNGASLRLEQLPYHDRLVHLGK